MGDKEAIKHSQRGFTRGKACCQNKESTSDVIYMDFCNALAVPRILAFDLFGLRDELFDG